MQKLGLIGHPVEHSMSKIMHEAVFKEKDIQASYDLFDVLPADLEDFISEVRQSLVGVNITIPHKVAVIDLVDELSKEAKLIGAVNTIKFENDRIIGYNTDGIGCIRALEEEGLKVEGSKSLILGAGGAARAIAFQLILEGSDVTISNITREIKMAEDLSKEILEKTAKEVGVIELQQDIIEKALEGVDILIHATPVGMHPNTNETIINPSAIPRNVSVMDIVYNPVETLLISECKKNELKTISGVGMLVHQGAEALKIWLGIEPPIDVMRSAVLDNLSTQH